MSAPIKGVDLASWQHPDNKPIDWPEVKKAGVAFAIIKATQGDSYTNPWLKRDLAEARAAGILVGAYHFYETGVPPTEQAEYFTSSLVGEVLPLGVWIDWEPPAVADWTVTGDYNAMVEEIEKARNPVGLYVDQSWHQIFTRLNAVIKRLWLATLGVETCPPGVFIWQHAKGEVTGIEGEVDLDQLMSTRGINLPSVPHPKVAGDVPSEVTQPPESVRASEGPAGASADYKAAQTHPPVKP